MRNHQQSFFTKINCSLNLLLPHRKSTAVKDGVSLASMDIFAGCGGLTEGLHQVQHSSYSCPDKLHSSKEDIRA